VDESGEREKSESWLWTGWIRSLRIFQQRSPVPCPTKKATDLLFTSVVNKAHHTQRLPMGVDAEREFGFGYLGEA
jgi:hypothetical protein